ncbi:Uncharacterised protein [Alistipes sp. cv1]|mgnify:CR=1 FL=1|nr:Uncharacterised protein [Faecalibacterium prausnitzii]
MVHTSENKLIIEMDTRCPGNDIQDLQREIIDVMRFYDYKNFGCSNGCPFALLLDLLQATLPTFHQQKQMLEFTEMASDPAISENDIVEWFSSRKEFLLKEIENQ